MKLLPFREAPRPERDFILVISGMDLEVENHDCMRFSHSIWYKMMTKQSTNLLENAVNAYDITALV